MATLVPQPELAQVQQRNLQATQRPVYKENTLSDFALGLVGKVQEGLDAYNKENRDRLVALGASDYMNEYQREVGFLDRKNYNQGRNLQSVTENRLARQQTFFSEVQRLAQDPTTTPEQLDELGQEYQRGNVDDIFGSTEIDADYKEKLYEQVLKEDAVYLGHINDTIKKVNADRYTKVKLNVGASIYNDILKLNLTPEAMAVHLGAKFSYLQEQAKALKESSLEDAIKDAQPVISGTIQTILGQLDEADPSTPEVLQKLNTAAQVAAQEGYIDLASPILKDLREVTDRVYKYNGIQAKLKQEQYFHAVEMGEQSFDIETVRADVVSIENDPNLTPEQKAERIQAVWSFAERQNKAILDGKFAKDPSYILSFGSAQEYAAANYGIEGASEDLWYKTVISAAEHEGNFKAFAVSALLFDYAQNKTTRFEPKLMEAAGARMSTEFQGVVMSSDSQLKDSPRYKEAEAVFNTTGLQYRQWTTSNSNMGRAAALLAGIEDDNLRQSMQEVWESGGTISDLREKLQNPVQSQVKRQNFEKAWNALDQKSADLKGSFWHNSAGSFLNKMDDASRDYQLGIISQTIAADKFRYTSRTNTANPEALYQMALKDGIMLRNQYSDIAIGSPTNDAFKQNRITTSNGAPMGTALFAEVINGKRELIGEKLKIDPEDVLVQLGTNGDAFFYAIKDGQVQNFTGIAGMEGEKYHHTEWLKDMRSTYDARLAAGTKSKKGDIVIQDGAPIDTPKRVTVYGKDGKATVQSAVIPSEVAVGFGGNVELAQVVMRSLVDAEGFALYGKMTDVRTKGQSDGVVYGFGARQDKHLVGEGKQLIDEFKRNQGNMAAMMKTQGKFMEYHFRTSNVEGLLQESGLPVPTGRPLPKTAVMPTAAMYDAVWFGGRGGGLMMKEAFNAKSTVDGHRIFMSSPLYMKDKAVGTPAARRNQMFLDAIKYHHEQYKRK